MFKAELIANILFYFQNFVGSLIMLLVAVTEITVEPNYLII